MVKATQISVLARITGNVNADEVIGQRITIKKFYTSEGEVKPFVSARAVKYAIRCALKDRKFDIDPFQFERDRLFDSGNPVKYIDNDIFGFMVAKVRGEAARRRQAPIALSYLRALRDTAVKAELGLRAPRTEGSPLPFEIEVAEWIGRIDCLIYPYIGIFQGSEGEFEYDGRTYKAEPGTPFIDLDERKKRLQAFLEVFLTPSYVLPRRTNSLVIPEYIVALVSMSKAGPYPIYQYLDYKVSGGVITVDDGLLARLIQRALCFEGIWLIDYVGAVPDASLLKEKGKGLDVVSPENLDDIVEKIVKFMIE